jgi:hypothetical protein
MQKSLIEISVAVLDSMRIGSAEELKAKSRKLSLYRQLFCSCANENGYQHKQVASFLGIAECSVSYNLSHRSGDFQGFKKIINL